MMTDEDDPFMNIGGGCPVHGDDYMMECTVCGAEFCSRCYPNSAICPECAELPEDELAADQMEEPVADKDLEDEEAERLLREADELPADVVEADASASPSDADPFPAPAPKPHSAPRPARSAGPPASPPSSKKTAAARRQKAARAPTAKRSAARPAPKPAAKKPRAASPSQKPKPTRAQSRRRR